MGTPHKPHVKAEPLLKKFLEQLTDEHFTAAQAEAWISAHFTPGHVPDRSSTTKWLRNLGCTRASRDVWQRPAAAPSTVDREPSTPEVSPA